MEDNNINLLPKDLQATENKIMSQRGSNSPEDLAMHLPQNNLPEPAVKPQTSENGQNIPAVKKAMPAPEQKFDLTPKEHAILAGVEKDFSNHAKNSLPTNPDFKTVGGKGFLSKFFGRRRNRGRIVQNQPDKQGGKINLPKTKTLDVNLIPEGSDLLPLKKIYNYFYVSAGISLGIVALAFLAVVMYGQYLNSQENDLTTQLSASSVKFGQLQAKEKSLRQLSDRLEQIKKVFASHVYWTNFFTALERVTMPAVYYKSIDTSIDGVISLDGVADNLLTLARQYLELQQATDFIQSVDVTGITADANTGAVGFNLNLKFNPLVNFSK